MTYFFEIQILHFMFLFFVVLFATHGCFIPAAKKLAFALNWLDFPKKDGRRLHLRPIPYLGGIAVYAGILAGFGAIYVFLPSFRMSFTIPPWMIATLVGGGLLVCVGTLDDVYDISARKKLFIQMMSSF